MLYDETTQMRSQMQNYKDTGLQGEDDLATGFLERFQLANQLTYSRFTPTGRANNFEGKYDERDKALMEAGLTADPLLTRSRAENKTNIASGSFNPLAGFRKEGINPGIVDNLDSRLDNTYASNEELIQNIKQSHPDLNIKTDAEIEQEVIQDQLDLLDQDKDLQERSTFLGKVGYLTGSIAGWVRDPTHAASLLAGGAASRGASVLTNFFRVGAAEAAIEAAIVSTEKAGEVGFRRLTGEDVTVTQAVAEAGIDVAAAGVLGGAVGAVGGFIARAIPTAKNPSNAATEASADAVNAFNRNAKNTTAEQRQAAELLDETVRIAKAAPDGANYEQHMADYANARKSIVEGTEINKADEGVHGTEVDAPEGSKLADVEVAPEGEDAVVKSVRDSLEVEDVIFTERNLNNEVVSEKSAKEIMDGLEADEKAIKDTITCFGG